MSEVLNIYKTKFYDCQTGVMNNLTEEEIKRLKAILFFLPVESHICNMTGDYIEIETYDGELIYIYCDTRENTNKFCEHLLFNEKDPFIDIEYTAKCMFCTEQMIHFLIDENRNNKNSLIVRALQWHGYLTPRFNYIDDMPLESKTILMNFDSYKVLSSEYTMFYNKKELEGDK